MYTKKIVEMAGIGVGVISPRMLLEVPLTLTESYPEGYRSQREKD